MCRMDIDEIMENFQAEPHLEFDGGDPEVIVL